MVLTSDSRTLALIHDSKQPSTNPLPLNDFMADTLTQVTLKTDVPAKIHNNTSAVGFADGLISPKTVTRPTGSAPCNAKDNVSLANNMRCTGTIFQRHVH